MSTNTPGPALPPLPDRLRSAALALRTKSMPLADFIPLLQESADALAAVEAREADTARLDWLESDGCSHVFKLGKHWYTRANYGEPYWKRKNIREAIDAAIAAAGSKA